MWTEFNRAMVGLVKYGLAVPEVGFQLTVCSFARQNTVVMNEIKTVLKEEADSLRQHTDVPCEGK
jgi:hypothetical protein